MAKKLPTVSSREKKSTAKDEPKIEEKILEETPDFKVRPGSFASLIFQ